MFETVLDYIARTNLFNFLIFASIIIYLFIKLDIIGGLNEGANQVAVTVKDSESAKEISESNLKSIEEMIFHLQEEIDAIIKQSESSAKLVGEKILTDAQRNVEVIKENTEKLIDNKTALERNDIMKRASLASVQIAKEHIIKELQNNVDLHNKLIDESLEEIDGVTL